MKARTCAQGNGGLGEHSISTALISVLPPKASSLLLFSFFFLKKLIMLICIQIKCAVLVIFVEFSIEEGVSL